MGVWDKMLEELREKGYGEWKGASEIKSNVSFVYNKNVE